jgi:3-isopropylmalate/(R)-2-methylmalate dehydratase small subunit
VSALKGHDLIIVAEGFARIFLQNAINLGLQVLTAPGIQASEGDALEMTADAVVNKSTGQRVALVQLPRARQAIIDAGGLIPYTRKRLLEKRTRAQ